MTHDATARAAERLRQFYDRFAPDYDQWMERFDTLLLDDGRARTCSRASGQTLEIAIGTGRNLAFYPSHTEITGIDQSPGMLAVARRRAQELGRDVDLGIGDAQSLDFPNASFDTVVCTLALCTIPNPRRALAEAHRVLRSGGQFLWLEHVRSPFGPVRWVERLLDPVLTRFASDHLLRDPVDDLGAVGFRLERCDRSKWGIIEEGVARKR